ncbi:hypothetical protein HDV06_004222 [Boothiomyces sp. JEL0866]|nr:hypothetical protein HDV06_004222 [Boothiomyces sp. JEL0866]
MKFCGIFSTLFNKRKNKQASNSTETLNVKVEEKLEREQIAQRPKTTRPRSRTPSVNAPSTRAPSIHSLNDNYPTTLPKKSMDGREEFSAQALLGSDFGMPLASNNDFSNFMGSIIHIEEPALDVPKPADSLRPSSPAYLSPDVKVSLNRKKSIKKISDEDISLSRRKSMKKKSSDEDEPIITLARKKSMSIKRPDTPDSNPSSSLNRKASRYEKTLIDMTPDAKFTKGTLLDKVDLERRGTVNRLKDAPIDEFGSGGLLTHNVTLKKQDADVTLYRSRSSKPRPQKSGESLSRSKSKRAPADDVSLSRSRSRMDKEDLSRSRSKVNRQKSVRKDKRRVSDEDSDDDEPLANFALAALQQSLAHK